MIIHLSKKQEELANDIVKQIIDCAETNHQVDEMLERIARLISWHKEHQKPQLFSSEKKGEKEYSKMSK